MDEEPAVVSLAGSALPVESGLVLFFTQRVLRSATSDLPRSVSLWGQCGAEVYEGTLAVELELH
ncbi:hypothetical protein MCEMSE15_02862 [Fimbriimonadaceae bacterium]